MKKRIFIVVILLIIVFGGIFGYRLFVNYEIGKFMSNFKAPAVAVEVVTVKSTTWDPYITSTGSLEAVQGVDISPQVSGIVKSIHFQSGQMVKKDQILVELDTDVLDAQLQGYLAAEKLAQLNFDRAKTLLKLQAIAKVDYDTDLSTLNQAMANVQQTQEQIAQKIIRAPFDGKIGIRQINIGQYLNPGQVITNVQTVDPIYVNFTIPQQNINQLKLNQAITVAVETYPNMVFQGKINAIDAEVSDDTKSINVQALISNNNPKAMLYPGMFVNVQVLLPQQENVIAVPQTAISYTLYGNSVFVVTSQGQASYLAKRTYVSLGDQQGDSVAITKGLNAGDIIVTDGQSKLQDSNPVSFAPPANS